VATPVLSPPCPHQFSWPPTGQDTDKSLEYPPQQQTKIKRAKNLTKERPPKRRVCFPDLLDCYPSPRRRQRQPSGRACLSYISSYSPTPPDSVHDKFAYASSIQDLPEARQQLLELADAFHPPSYQTLVIVVANTLYFPASSSPGNSMLEAQNGIFEVHGIPNLMIFVPTPLHTPPTLTFMLR
jgi:hypothetical protein